MYTHVWIKKQSCLGNKTRNKIIWKWLTSEACEACSSSSCTGRTAKRAAPVSLSDSTCRDHKRQITLGTLYLADNNRPWPRQNVNQQPWQLYVTRLILINGLSKIIIIFCQSVLGSLEFSVTLNHGLDDFLLRCYCNHKFCLT